MQNRSWFFSHLKSVHVEGKMQISSIAEGFQKQQFYMASQLPLVSVECKWLDAERVFMTLVLSLGCLAGVHKGLGKGENKWYLTFTHHQFVIFLFWSMFVPATSMLKIWLIDFRDFKLGERKRMEFLLVGPSVAGTANFTLFLLLALDVFILYCNYPSIHPYIPIHPTNGSLSMYLWWSRLYAGHWE